MPEIKTGLLTDVVNNLENFIPDLPGPIDNMVKDAVNTAVAVVDPSNPTQEPATPPQVVPPTATPQQKNEIVTAIDAIVSAVNLALRFRFLIPDQYEKPLEILVSALTKVRGWVD